MRVQGDKRLPGEEQGTEAGSGPGGPRLSRQPESGHHTHQPATPAGLSPTRMLWPLSPHPHAALVHRISAHPTAPQPPPRCLCCPSSPTSSPFPQERSFQLQCCPATPPRTIQSQASPDSPQILFLLFSPSISPTTWVSGGSPNVPAEPLPRTLSPQSFHVWGRRGFRSQLKCHLLRGASPTSPAKSSHQSLALTSLDCNFCTASTSVCHFPVCLLFIYCQPLPLEI